MPEPTAQLELLDGNAAPFVLRDYQETAVGEVLAHLPNNPILVAPTGSGKTVMGVEAVRRHGGRVLWIAHRIELIEQAAHALTATLHESIGVIKSGVRPNPDARVQVASIQTLTRRTMPGADLVGIDECHHACAATYCQVFERYSCPIFGLTATPFRLDGKGLGEAGFRYIAVAAYSDELCKQGILHAPRVFAGKAPDLKGVRILGGDYNLSGLAERVRDVGLVGDIVETWKTKTPDRKTLCFAVDVEHSKSITEAFINAGVKAAHIDASTDPLARRGILNDLRDGRITVICNCQILTEGWDLPALEVAIIARPTASLNLHLQMIGRIMRSCRDKAGCVVLDHAGNHHTHGLVTRRLEYSLDSKVRAGESEPLGLRRCPECLCLFEPHLGACPNCGWIPEEAKGDGRKVKQIDGELVEFVEDFEYRTQVWDQLVAYADAWNYKPGYAAYRYKERFGGWPVLAFGQLVNPDTATREQKREVFKQLASTAQERGYKPGWASWKYKDIFRVWPQGFVDDVRAELNERQLSAVERGRAEAAWNQALRNRALQDEEEETF